jgi:Flp pilus assembly protein TadG
MIAKLRRLLDEQGTAATEMAIALPVLVMMIYGIFQMSVLFYANAGMQHALGEGARFATLYSTERTISVSTTSGGATTTTSKKVYYPSETAVKTLMSSKLFGPNDGTFTISEPTYDASGFYYLHIRYVRPMDFLFFQGPTITLNRDKRVYLATSS